MSTTTQILFNSPALHSLKRDQLVKLCKIHSIKANGKNVDLIQKLKEHAQLLPKDAPLSVAARSEEDNSEGEEEAECKKMPRPSEQWEVLESIEEEDSQGTMSSSRTLSTHASGEFGTGSTKVTSVSSSLKSLANSFGLKRTMAKATASDELAQHAVPYSSLPETHTPPQTDNFTFTPSAFSEDNSPVPGHPLRAGVPAPTNARLSLGITPATPSRPSGPTTTIRLVTTAHDSTMGTPQLKPFKTSFDLMAGSPLPLTHIWPPPSDRLYPDLAMEVDSKADEGMEPDMPGALSPASPNASAFPMPPPFVFGSPIPQPTPFKFEATSAATNAVLEEMNRRLAGEGVPTLNSDILERPWKGITSEEPAPSKMSMADRFKKVHDAQFNQMDSIVNHYAAKRAPVVPKKRRSSVLEALAPIDGPGGKRRPSVVAASKARVISSGRRKNTRIIPGGFDEDTDSEGEDDVGETKAVVEGSRRESKRVKVSLAPAGSAPLDEEQEMQKQKEREAIRRKLDANKARRRSSIAAGRASIGKSLVPTKKGAISRFGFLSRATSIVQNVWNRGAGSSNTTTTKSTSIPSSSKPQATAALAPKTATSMGPPVPPKKPLVPKKSIFGGTSRTSTVSSAKSLKPPVNGNGTVNSTNSSARSRSPLPPSFSGTTKSGGSTLNSTNSRVTTGSNSRVSSIGAKTSVAVSRVSSLGTRGSAVSVANSTGGKKSSSVAKRPSVASGSRLTAPTASSLAKRASTVGINAIPESQASREGSGSKLPAVVEKHSGATALDQITNVQVVSPRAGFTPKRNSTAITSPLATYTPRPAGTIFKNPLLSPSSIPTPVRTRGGAPQHTLGAAAVNLASSKGDVEMDEPMKGGAEPTPVEEKPPIPPKPKILPGRKPRISRSKVIAKLASQRAAASGSGSGTAASGAGGGAVAASGGRTRSSFGGAKRQSLGGAKGRGSGVGAESIVMSAKKRARQSEYSRRRSRAETGSTAEMLVDV